MKRTLDIRELVAGSDDFFIKVELAKNIAQEIRELGITQQDAATLVGVAQPDISDICRGRVQKKFSAERLGKVLFALREHQMLSQLIQRVEAFELPITFQNFEEAFYPRSKTPITTWAFDESSFQNNQPLPPQGLMPSTPQHAYA